LGTESGNAIAQVLYGDYNPSGKLPMSFPRSVGQIPISYNSFSTGRPNQNRTVFWSGYNDEDKSPLYPFGYGLSYTTFEYSNLKTNKLVYEQGEKVKVSIDIKNTGKYQGKEVVQLYIHDIAASIVRPIKELKGFELIDLNPGESKTINFVLTDKELGFYTNTGDFIVEPGIFNVMVGTSSADFSETKIEIK